MQILGRKSEGAKKLDAARIDLAAANARLAQILAGEGDTATSATTPMAATSSAAASTSAGCANCSIFIRRTTRNRPRWAA